MNKHLFASLALAPLAVTHIQASSTQPRPNIILFMVDDMGWQDTSLPFWTEKTHYNEVFETPNMERLAKQGMMFTNAYANSISSPTRCSLFTGANAARHRVTNWTLEKNQSTDRKDKELAPPQWNVNGIAQVQGTENTYVGHSFVQSLKNSGYHTIHCGKLHLGAIDTPGETPYHFGFEVNISGHAAGGLASYLGEENYGNTGDPEKRKLNAVPGLEKYWGTDTFVTEALTLEAIEALEKAQKYNQPFFLYMAHYAIHIPIDKDMRFYQKYIDKGMTPKEAAYATLIEGMDKSLGDLMDWLEASGEADNTVIIFMSDNGGLATQAGWRDGELFTQNYPLNSGKGSLYEGGIREPMIVSWLGKVQPDTRCEQPIIIEDFYPTILEMAGTKVDKTPQVIDGKSFMPWMMDAKQPIKERALTWNLPNNWGNDGPGINFNTAIRKGDWKLVYYYRTGKKELFNLKQDIGEKNNLALQHPEIVKRLSKELGKTLRSMDAQRPTVIATGQLCAWPDEV